MRPKRISTGCYAVICAGHTIILRRFGRSGFRIEHQPGRLSPLYRRLRDAAKVAVESANPWPFDVPKKFCPDLDMPNFLRRTA